MEENEIKILEINRPEIEKKLIKLGATKIFEGILESEAFDKNGKLLKNKKYLRLRKEGNLTKLTYKEPSTNKSKKIKSKDEYEITVSEYDTTKKILQSLGFLPWISLKKTRISYKLNNIRFEFDKYHDSWEFIPEFMEIEGPSEEIIFEYANILGFSKDECKTWGGKKVADYYQNKIK
ncbi:class IV adenylate cyclase [Candidatus Woesearchaeota archaeon]|nr:class IV adenylate cyclase [Candidatus Woesearchaeota archaeon]MCF7901116.1 class IV adenylate cyclase [Candidatus Woesearchaeota archaeon]MCF8012895.1 class IV adenylate cyclase [Candidatus Woesearchaeota archaeon]